VGREIRMVPPNWEHPKKDDKYQPMYDKDFDKALKNWVEEYELWKQGKHPDQEGYPYWEYAGGPPDPEYYQHNITQDKTWVQVYETVSEGTPVTPPFATKEELIDYLVGNGTFWDSRGWRRENAEKFVESGWAPSGIFNTATGEFKTARDGI